MPRAVESQPFITRQCRTMCSFLFDKASKLFIYGFNKETLLEINALRRRKILFQGAYRSKSSRNPLSSSRPRHAPPNKSNLATALHGRENLREVIFYLIIFFYDQKRVMKSSVT